MVTDPSGASVPRAKVVVKNLATQVVRTAIANVEGFYSAPNLAPGEYEVTVTAAGFDAEVSRFTLTIGSEGELNFALRIGSVEQTMEVEAPAAGIGLAQSTLGAVVDRTTIEKVPLNGRSWTDLAALEPGTMPVETQASYAAGNPRGNRGFGAQLSVSGARPPAE